MINVTKTFLPPIEEYEYFIRKAYETNQLTNQGPLVCDLQDKLKKYLNVNNFHYVANGTLALQLALEALDIKDAEVITTPFSYVATTSSILWQNCKPVFVDIEENNFTIDANKIEKAITSKTKAIMAVHVFGYACDIEKIDQIAKKYELKVIYDGAHAFGAKYHGKSLLDYGDVSTCSFHSTKLFHTVEGGCVIAKDGDISNKLELNKRFGHNGDDHIQLGINAKNSEMHAGMGLANLPYIEQIINERKKITELYDLLLKNIQRPAKQIGLEYNYGYYPVLFENEKQLVEVFEALNKENIKPRRYFYPSLNTLPYVENSACPISQDVSGRIACLPLYVGLEEENIEKIARIINEVV